MVSTAYKARSDMHLQTVQFSGAYRSQMKNDWPTSMFEGVREALGDLHEAAEEHALAAMDSSTMAVLLEKAVTDSLHWRLDVRLSDERCCRCFVVYAVYAVL